MRKVVPSSLRWLGPLGLVLVRQIVARLQSKYRAEGSSTSMVQVRCGAALMQSCRHTANDKQNGEGLKDTCYWSCSP